jgi:hypothetical protein
MLPDGRRRISRQLSTTQTPSRFLRRRTAVDLREGSATFWRDGAGGGNATVTTYHLKTKEPMVMVVVECVCWVQPARVLC